MSPLKTNCTDDFECIKKEMLYKSNVLSFNYTFIFSIFFYVMYKKYRLIHIHTHT